MTTWFTADTHFGHGGAIGFWSRPFASAAEMDEAMIERWNACVHTGDDVWHLGDFALRPGPDRAERLLERLNGRIRLVAGNNDPDTVRSMPGWHEVTEFAEIRLDGLLTVLCHYPLRSWRDQSKGAWQLHGHSHGRLKPLTRQRDVGVDVHGFAPVTFETLRAWRPPRPKSG